MFELRDYQMSLVEADREALRRHLRVLMQLATGAGKTIIFVYITMSAAQKGRRVIIVAHRAEIISQISAALDSMGVRHGRLQPGHRMTDDPIQCAMVHTLVGRISKVPEPDLIVLDEAHHAISPSYQTIFTTWPKTRVLGVTATPQRLDGKGLGRIFDEMVIGPSPGDLIQAGWLAPYRYLAPPSMVDLSRIKKRAGDYAVDELADAMDRAVITGDAIQHWKTHLAPRSAIVFTVTVPHAEHVAAQFQEAGISAASVDGTMDRATRRDRIEGLGNGKYLILTSCALISEGLDVPNVGGVILLRPTESLALHLQQIGRGMRPKLDGSHCGIMDHVGNVHRHGLPDALRNWNLADKQKKEVSPVAQCEVCYRIFASGPDWRESHLGTGSDCEQPEHPKCLLHQSSESEGGGVAGPPAVVEGVLVEFTATPTWANGCNILLARGAEYRALLQAADTRDKVEHIRRARGYKPGWTRYIMDSRG